MSVNTKAIAARDAAEDQLITAIQHLATIDALLDTKEIEWLATPIASRTVAGHYGNDSITYDGWLNYWRAQRADAVKALEGLERLIESLNSRIQTQQPFMLPQVMKVRV